MSHMIYAISSQGYWTGTSREIGDRDGMPRGWTRSPVPDLAPDEYAVWNGNGWNVTTEPPPGPVITTDDVDTERDRRIESGMTFNGVRYQTRAQDRENVAGASILALAAMVNGAQPGDLRWHGGDTDFVWIAEDNSLNTMDAQTFFAFGQAMAAHKSALIFAARGIKDMDPIPDDYATNETYWPAQ